MNKEKNNNNIDLNRNKSKLKQNKKLIIAVLIVLIILIAIIFGIGYSRYIVSLNGSSSQDIAEMICNMEVVPSEENRSIINPYCIVTVKNYNSEDKITETDVNYTIEVVPKEDFEMPEYYWQDSEGRIIARDAEVSGNFKNQEKSTHEYKIVFKNSGEQDTIGLVEFNLKAIQGN